MCLPTQALAPGLLASNAVFRVKFSNFRYPLWAISIAAAVVLLDQGVKQLVIANLAPNTPTAFIGDLVKLYLIRNDSAAFSLGFGATWIFTLISSSAVVGAIWYSFKIRSQSWAILLGFLLGGIAGNLVDRLFRSPGFPNGHVVDYLQIPFGFPVFNIADIVICAVAALVVIRVVRGDNLGGIPEAE